MLTNFTALVSSNSTTGHSYFLDKKLLRGVNIEYQHQLACFCMYFPSTFLLLIYNVVKYMSSSTNIMIDLLLLFQLNCIFD